MASSNRCSTLRSSPQLHAEGTKPWKRTSFLPVDQLPVKVPQLERPVNRPLFSNSIVSGGCVRLTSWPNTLTTRQCPNKRALSDTPVKTTLPIKA